jgi:hypothetical protein
MVDACDYRAGTKSEIRVYSPLNWWAVRGLNAID